MAMLDKLLEVIPRPMITRLAHTYGGVKNPNIVVRSALKNYIIAADSPDMRLDLLRSIAKELKINLPDK